MVSGRAVSRNTVLVGGATLFADMATEMLTPILPVFLTQALNANGSVVGLVDGIAQAIRNIIDGLSGPISDMLRQRRSIALAGYAATAVSKPLMGLSPIWEGVLAARVLDRMGAGVCSAPREAIIAASVDARHKGGAFGIEGVGQKAGAFAGPLITLALLSALQVDMRTVFYLASVPALLAFAFMFMVSERRPDKGPQAKTVVRLRDFPAVYWKYLLAMAIFSIGNSSNSFLILRTQEIGASIATTTLIYAGFNLVAAIAAYPLSSLSDKWGRRTVLLGACFAFMIVYAGFSLLQSIAGIAGLFMLYGLFEGGFRSVGRAFASDFVPERLRASGIGWFSATIGLCQLVAGIVAGLIWDHVGHVGTFLYGVVFAAAGMLAIVLLVQARHEPV